MPTAIPRVELTVIEQGGVDIIVLDVPGLQVAGAVISTDLPQSLGVPSAGSTGLASDAGHVHAHGNQIGGSLHALATSSGAGFLSSTLFSLLNGATSSNTVNSLVRRDGSGNFSANVITADLNGTASAIANDSVTDVKVAANAAIAGTKIVPDFGAQDIQTTGGLGVGNDINLDDGGTFTTTLQMVTATADRTISFPDATGTVALVAGSSGQLIYNAAGALAGGPLYDSTAGTFGYVTGGAITQGTSKSTGVTLSGASGKITMNAEALAGGAAVSFVLTNSSIAAGDLIVLNHVAGGTLDAYSFNVRSAAGSATIAVRNVTGGSLSEALVLGFAIIKS